MYLTTQDCIDYIEMELWLRHCWEAFAEEEDKVSSDAREENKLALPATLYSVCGGSSIAARDALVVAAPPRVGRRTNSRCQGRKPLRPTFILAEDPS